MGDKMNNAPVFFTLAQVRFNHYSKLDEIISDIQETLRLAHFPDFRQENVQTLGFDGKAAKLSQQDRFVFGNTEGTANFILNHSSLSFQTTNYETYEEFSQKVKLGINTLNDAVPNGLDYVSRLGIRYFDAVQPSTQETLNQYLIKEVLGLSDKVTGRLTHSFSETISTSEHGSLFTRVIIKEGKLGLPVEVANLAPKITAKFEAHEGRHAVIDSDAANEIRRPFDVDQIMTKLNGLHEDIKNSFEQLITDYALDVWK